MVTFITLVALGIFVSVMGAINMTGNISTIHSYHRRRVTEENRKPFGMLVGIGTLMIGIGIIIFGTMFFIFEKTGREIYTAFGAALLVASIIGGSAISFYAMIKYNKGIF